MTNPTHTVLMQPVFMQRLRDAGLTDSDAQSLLDAIGEQAAGEGAADRWSRVSRSVLEPDLPFAVHRLVFDAVFADWQETDGPRPAWSPTPEYAAATNEGEIRLAMGMNDYLQLHAWSVTEREAYWALALERLGIHFREKYAILLDTTDGAENPKWLAGARLNIVESCFSAGDGSTAILWQAEGGPIQRMTGGELRKMTNRVSNALAARGLGCGDPVAIAMPMTAESVAIYLGVIQVGGVVVSIADSFAPAEIATRLKLGGAKALFTQDVIERGGRTLPMYDKALKADAPPAFVLPCGNDLQVQLRPGDTAWEAVLEADDRFEAVPRDPRDPCNVLFSSGTTGTPKAIPWTHVTPIKCAADGHFHQDIRRGDVVAWPTNLGWMMGPWLIFAGLMNRASIALYYGAPTGAEFCRFVRDARVTMLGLVPSLVKAWRNADCTRGLDWSSVRVFSSTGECSNADDYLWLMSRAGYKPVIEYCGGTEIGGGYLTGSVTRPASPATFSAPALGLDLCILDADGRPADKGEVYLVPPSMGLSQELLNRDHHEEYFADVPPGPNGETLRRHGDEVERLAAGFFRAHGRTDDTMNLRGIKVSAAEIERTLSALDGVRETAAVSIAPQGGGPGQLVVYAVPDADSGAGPDELKAAMQAAVRSELNPLVKIHEVVVVGSLPRTASNKVMRRVLRDRHAEAKPS